MRRTSTLLYWNNKKHNPKLRFLNAFSFYLHLVFDTQGVKKLQLSIRISPQNRSNFRKFFTMSIKGPDRLVFGRKKYSGG